MTLLQPAQPSQTRASISLFGGGGSGKTVTSILIALGLSIERHNRAGIVLFDPEDVADFVLEMCRLEGVPLFTVKSRSFVDMREALAEAEAAGHCAFVVDHYDGVFRELTEAQKVKLDLVGRRLPYAHREELQRIWDEWVRRFRASSCHCIFNGRLGWEWGDDEDESGDPIKVKLGAKMRGDADAGYEPNLLLELEAIQDLARRHKKSRSKSGSITHYLHVLKDRRMVLNGLHFSFKDLNGYQPGDYKSVYKALSPHFDGLATSVGSRPVSRSSADLFSAPRGESAFAERSRRVAIAVEEIQAALNTIWPGQTAEDKRLRNIVMETLFKTRSWTAVQGKTPEEVESAWTMLRHFEADADGINVRAEAEVIALIASCRELERERVEATVL